MSTRKEKSKLTSRRFWAALWAMSTTTGVMIASIFSGFEASWIGVTLPLLIGVVMLWIGAESYTKSHQTPPPQGERNEQ
jgi:putative Mn2+ efflux pump MntP